MTYQGWNFRGVMNKKSKLILMTDIKERHEKRLILSSKMKWKEKKIFAKFPRKKRRKRKLLNLVMTRFLIRF
jgi:hypothetical protein